MECIAYKVAAHRNIKVLDTDGCLRSVDKCCFEDLCLSKVHAIAKAQKLFSKGADYVIVRKIVITEKGAKNAGRVYSKFRQT